MKKFSFKKFLSYVPGFRTNVLWKKILASFYYFACLLTIFSQPSSTIFSLALPFLIFYSIDWYKNRKKGPYPKTRSQILILALMLVLGSSLFSQPSNGPEGSPPGEDREVAREEPSPSREDRPGLKEIKAQEKETEPAIEKEPEKEPLEEPKPSPDVFTGEGDLRLHFIDIGQGDSIFIQLPNGENLLLDGGPSSSSDRLLAYLRSLDISKIDYMVASHPHEDHIGGLPAVINNFSVRKFYMPNKSHTTRAFSNLVEAIDREKLDLVKTKTGTILVDQPGLRLRALAPDPNTSSSNLNDYSIVLRLDFNDTSFLLTGDAEASTEQYLMADNSDQDLRVDLLKLAHHGSNTSSLPGFLKIASPSYGIISCQKGNSYGHPHQEVLERLEANKVRVYRTDRDGTIIASSDGSSISFETKGDPMAASSGSTATSSGQDQSRKEEASDVQPEKQASPSDQEVLITPTGSKYHKRPCGRGNYTPSSLADAQALKLEPCKKCFN